MSTLDSFFELNRESLDWRWHYHYSISLMLQSRITEASRVLGSYRSDRTDVSVLQSSLCSLAKRLMLFSQPQNQPVDWKSDFNPYFIDSTSNVIVVFSGWTGALGYVSDRTIADYFHKLGFNLLILRDPSLKFFSGGLAPSKFTSNFSNELHHFLADKTSGQVYFCGDSISALAAIYHACQFPTNIKVIAFSPVLSKDDYSDLGLSYFDNAEQLRSKKDLVQQTRGHQSLIRIEATRNLYPNIFDLLESTIHIDLHIVYAELNKTDSLVAHCFQKNQKPHYIVLNSGVHLVSNEFIGSSHFLTLLENTKSFPTTSTYGY